MLLTMVHPSATRRQQNIIMPDLNNLGCGDKKNKSNRSYNNNNQEMEWRQDFMVEELVSQFKRL